MKKEIKTEAERQKVIKKLSLDIEKLKRQYKKKRDAFLKTNPDEKADFEWVGMDPLLSKRNKLISLLSNLESHPVRFLDLQKRLQKSKSKQLKLNSKDFETILAGLDLAAKLQKLCSQNNRLILKEIQAETALTVAKGTSEYNFGKNLREAAKVMGWTTGNKGKRSLWPPERLDFLKQDFLARIGPDPSQEEKKQAILQMYQDYGCFSPNELSKQIYKTGLRNIPRFDYTPKKTKK